MGFERNRVKSLVFVVSDKYFIDHESGSRSIYMCRYTSYAQAQLIGI